MKKLLYKIFIHNIGAKLLSIIFAFSLWIYVVSSGNKIDFFPADFQIKIKGVREDLAVANDLGKVKIKIKAPILVWKSLSSDDFEVYIELAGLDEGVEQVDIKVISKNQGATVLEKDPLYVLVRLEPKISKKLPIVVENKGSPAKDYKVGEGVSETKEAEVSGAESLVKSLSYITALVELKGDEKSPIDASVKLVAIDASSNILSNLEFFPSYVHVNLPIIQLIEIKSVGVKVKVTGEPEKGFWVNKIQVDPQIVTISGEIDFLKDVDFVETEAIDITGTSSSVSTRAKLVPQDKINLLVDKDVKVMIFVTGTPSIKSLTPSINYQNGGGRKASLSETITVTVSGPLNILNSLKSDNVILNVDLGEYSGLGIYTLMPKKEMVQIPDQVEVIKILPTSVSLTIY